MFAMNPEQQEVPRKPEEQATMKLSGLLESATGRRVEAGFVAGIVDHIIDAAVERMAAYKTPCDCAGTNAAKKKGGANGEA